MELSIVFWDYKRYFSCILWVATGICPKGRTSKRQQLLCYIPNYYCGRFSHTPTVIHGFWQPSTKTKNTVKPCGCTVFLVEATGFEPTTFASRTQRATNCVTPRFGFFRKWSNMWSNHSFRDFFIKLY